MNTFLALCYVFMSLSNWQILMAGCMYVLGVSKCHTSCFPVVKNA